MALSYLMPRELADTSAWRTTDRSWVAKREQQWRAIHEALNKPTAGAIQAHELKTLREYFLAGRMAEPTRWGAHRYPSLLLLHRLWLHPDRSAANWARQVKFTIWTDYDESVRALVSLVEDHDLIAEDLAHRIYRALLGGDPVRTFLNSNEYYRERRVWQAKSIAEHYTFEPAFLAAALQNVRTDVRMARIYFVPQLRQALSYDHGNIERDVLNHPKRPAHLAQLFELIVTGSYRPKLKGAAASAVQERNALASDLVTIFDRGQGPAALQELWLKSRRSAKAPKPRKLAAPPATTKRTPRRNTSAAKRSAKKSSQKRATRRASSTRR